MLGRSLLDERQPRLETRSPLRRRTPAAVPRLETELNDVWTRLRKARDSPDAADSRSSRRSLNNSTTPQGVAWAKEDPRTLQAEDATSPGPPANACRKARVEQQAPLGQDRP
eukprot:9486179-Pyramimonas_sp.AAC.1